MGPGGEGLSVGEDVEEDGGSAVVCGGCGFAAADDEVIQRLGRYLVGCHAVAGAEDVAESPVFEPVGGRYGGAVDGVEGGV